MLRCEDPNNDDNLVGWFEDSEEFDTFPAGHEPNLESFFEHGQWWISDKVSGAAWSVNDAEIDGDDGYSFEQVSDGEFD